MSRSLIHGQIPVRTDRPLIFATDGSVQLRPVGTVWQTGWGYLSTHGHYGLGWCPQPRHIAGRDRPVVAELRAVWHAVGEAMQTGPVVLILDSARAIQLIELWKRGRMSMPGGYIGSQTHTPRLTVLAQTVAAHPGNITVHRVPGHSGYLLNEAADALARVGARWKSERLTRAAAAARARFIAEGFLAATLEQVA